MDIMQAFFILVAKGGITLVIFAHYVHGNLRPRAESNHRHKGF